MDDISREPLPDSAEPADAGDALTTKGPAELLRMAEQVVDETQIDRLHVEPVGGRFNASSEQSIAEQSIAEQSIAEQSIPEQSIPEPELVAAAQALASDQSDAMAGDSRPTDPQSPSEEGEVPTAATGDVDAPQGAPKAATRDGTPELMGPALPEGLLDSHVRKDSAAAADELALDAVPLTEPSEVAKVAMAVMLSTREVLSPMRLAEICNTSQKVIKVALEMLEADLREQGMPLEVQRSGDGYKLLTVPAVHPYLRRIKGVKKAERLTPASLETLAVIAYRQPVIRAEIESIRGVKVGPMLRSLLDHKLIKVLGRADVPGRPLQYGTGQVFLDRFGLGSLKDLPSIQEFRSLG